MQHYSGNKAHYVARVECVDSFNFNRSIEVFKSIYGAGIIIVFVCL